MSLCRVTATNLAMIEVTNRKIWYEGKSLADPSKKWWEQIVKGVLRDAASILYQAVSFFRSIMWFQRTQVTVISLTAIRKVRLQLRWNWWN